MSRAPSPPARPRSLLFVALGLVALTLAAFHGVGRAEFLNLDDDAYVQHQPLVNQGLRAPAVVWAFTSAHSNNWHPLTTLSHQLDCTLFGLNPAAMHWENLGWHALNTLLVFFVWRALTGATGRSALVAALFAVHPLHVESVAWISERKDVLCGFFWLLGLAAYVRYVRAPSAARYTLVALALVCALLSKPMAVTFPCVLLLLDAWPLGRWPARTWRSLVTEKLPLFGIVAAHSAITFAVQSSTGAAQFGERFSLGARIGNALVSYVRYAGKTLWPESLAPLYFHPGYWPTLAVAGSVVLLAAASGLAWWQRRSQPWLLVGWLWFLGTLVPVIGLVQVGAQSMADRYMYLPILGLFTAAVWGAARIVETRRALTLAAAAAAGVGLLALGFATVRQVSAWRNSLSLYEHSIRLGEDNAAVRYLYAIALQLAGRPSAEVVAQFNHALRLRPDYVNASTQLAVIALGAGRVEESARLIARTVEQEPKNAALRVNLAALLHRIGRVDDAIRRYQEVLALDPRSLAAHGELARIYLSQNRPMDALPHLKIRAEVDPWSPAALIDYARVLTLFKRYDEARELLSRALWIRPNDPEARQQLNAISGGKG